MISAAYCQPATKCGTPPQWLLNQLGIFAKATCRKASGFEVSWSTDRRFRSNSVVRMFRPSIYLRAIKRTSLQKDLGLGCRHGRAIGTVPESLRLRRALPEWVWTWFGDSAKKLGTGLTDLRRSWQPGATIFAGLFYQRLVWIFCPFSSAAHGTCALLVRR